MNVAFFCECFRPLRNGVVTSIETFRHQLTRLGHRVHIFAPEFPGYRNHDEDVYRFPSFTFPHVKDYPVAFPFAPRLTLAFRRLPVDIVHAQSPWWLGRLGAYLARRRNLPLVLTYHTLVTEYLHYIPLPRRIVKPALLALLRQYCNASDLVIVPTESIGDVLREQGVTTRIVPLPTGVDVAHIAQGNRQMIRDKYRLAPHTLALIYVGRMAFEKSVDFLLYAVAKPLRERENVVLFLVGSGPYEENVKAIAQQLGIAHKVIFVGSVPHDDVRHYLAASDIFVFASRTETQGIVIAEAMAAGLPCVAVDAYGVSTVLSHGVDGFLTIPDVHAFTLSLETLLDSPTLRQQFADNARRNARKFSAESSARRLVSLYEEVIENRKRRNA